MGEIFETGSATYRVSRNPRLYHYLITRDKKTLGISMMIQCLHNSLKVPTHGSFTAALKGSAISFTYSKQCGNFSCLPCIASPVADHLFALHVSQRQNSNSASTFPGYPALQENCGCYGRKHGIVIILPAANICFLNVNFTLPCSVTIPAFFTGIFLFQS